MTRRQQVVASAGGLIPFGHLGWGYRDRSELWARAAEYLADGLELNQSVQFVGAGNPDELRAQLTGIPVLAARPDFDRIGIATVDAYYIFEPGRDVIDVDVMLNRYVSMADEAVANGYTGFRAAVDVSSVARTHEQREAFARLEHLVDQKMAVLPFSALCAYDISQLGPAAAELLCLHPLASPGAAPFQLYAEPDAGFALAGDIDAASDELFTTALQRIWQLTADDPLVIDARDLRFIAHRQLMALDELASRDGRGIVLRTEQPVLARLAALVDLRNVRVQRPPPGADGCGTDTT
jgi:anti-anti-sigma regulatory factor